MNEKILNFAKISTLAVLLAFGITQVSSWTAPAAVAPNGYVSAPINVGNATQTKAGNLTVGSLTSNGDIDVTGDNLLNVATPIAPADGVNKAYVDAQGAVGGGGGGYEELAWGYTDKHFFLSSLQYNGDLGGTVGADAKCNTDTKAISGKNYRAVFGSFKDIGVGYYSDDFGSWVNSKLKISPPAGGDTNSRYLIINKNPTGMGSNTFQVSTPPSYIYYASDLNQTYQWSTGSKIWKSGGASFNCSNWTSSQSSGATASFSGVKIGELGSAVTGENCSNTHHLFCLEN